MYTNVASAERYALQRSALRLDVVVDDAAIEVEVAGRATSLQRLPKLGTATYFRARSLCPPGANVPLFWPSADTQRTLRRPPCRASPASSSPDCRTTSRSAA